MVEPLGPQVISVRDGASRDAVRGATPFPPAREGPLSPAPSPPALPPRVPARGRALSSGGDRAGPDPFLSSKPSCPTGAGAGKSRSSRGRPSPSPQASSRLEPPWPAALAVAAGAHAPAGRKRRQSPWRRPAGGCCRGAVPPPGCWASPPPGPPCSAVRTARAPQPPPAWRPLPTRGPSARPASGGCPGLLPRGGSSSCSA